MVLSPLYLNYPAIMPPNKGKAKAMPSPEIPSSDSRPTRSSARVAINTEDEGTRAKSTDKGKKRAAQTDTQPRTQRRVSQPADEPEASQSTDAEASVKRTRKPRGRAVTRFWKNNSSVAAMSSAPSKKKDFMSSGIYCQDPNPESPRKLVNRVLSRRHAELKAARKKGKAIAVGEAVTFPPMPYDYGESLFFEQEHEFVLPYDIQWAAENRSLDSHKRPDAYSKIRQSKFCLDSANVDAFPERTKVSSGITAICRCTAETGCGDGCDNRIMHYTCGKDCPAGEACNNKSLWKRKQPSLKVAYVSRTLIRLIIDWF
jgi:hypothetical protein